MNEFVWPAAGAGEGGARWPAGFDGCGELRTGGRVNGVSGSSEVGFTWI